jgi:hypothetical protein
MNRRATTCRAAYELDLGEISALCLRGGSNGRGELLAVGDEDFAIHVAAVDRDSLGERRRESVRKALPDKVAEAKGGSQWEAVAADGAGRVFVLRESPATVFVFSRNLDELEHTIHLEIEDSDNAAARQLLDDPNFGPEGMLLFNGGHLLLVKQKDPIVLIEFGPEDERAHGLSADAYLPIDESFELSGGSETKLAALASSELASSAEKTAKSANDLALDHRGRLHAISSKSRCLYELDRASGKDGISIAHVWDVPVELKAGGDRKAEGLAFDGEGRPIVALDVSGKGENAYVLDPLDRDND